MSAGAAGTRFTGDVTDALRAPTHRLTADSGGRAAGDLVFVDARRAHTTARTCVRRRDGDRVHTCFTVTTAAADVATVTPLHFRPGSYLVTWSVGGTVVARWRFVVT